MTSFSRGLRAKNPLILVLAALLLVPALSSLEAFFTSGQWTMASLEWCLRTARDSFTYVSWTVGHAKQTPPEGPAVYLLGGSAAREAIVSGQGLAADVAELGGPQITAYDLGSNNQNFAESLAVIDNVPNTPAWVLVGVNLGRFTPSKEENVNQVEGREFLLKSPALQEFVVDQWDVSERDAATIIPGSLAYLTDLSNRKLEALLGGGSLRHTYQPHVYRADKVRSDERKEELVNKWLQQRYPVYALNLDDNLQILEALLARAQERELHVVLVELPLNEAIVNGRFDVAQEKYQGPVHELALRYDAAYVDFNNELSLPSSSFYDLSHLVEPGREVWQHRLAQELVRLMNEDAAAQ